MVLKDFVVFVVKNVLLKSFEYTCGHMLEIQVWLAFKSPSQGQASPRSSVVIKRGHRFTSIHYLFIFIVQLFFSIITVIYGVSLHREQINIAVLLLSDSSWVKTSSLSGARQGHPWVVTEQLFRLCKKNLNDLVTMLKYLAPRKHIKIREKVNKVWNIK